MTTEQLDQMIVLLAALKAGKELQWKDKLLQSWNDTYDLSDYEMSDFVARRRRLAR